jgi:hypothetical protein
MGTACDKGDNCGLPLHVKVVQIEVIVETNEAVN